MVKISSKEQVLIKYNALDNGMKQYFSLLPELVKNISKAEPALAYCFQRIEMAQRIGLYVLLMRIYRTNSELAWSAVDKIDITRSGYPKLYLSITGNEFQNDLRDKIRPAELVRDRITHGRSQSSAQVNKAIVNCLEYAQDLNAKFQADSGFKPIGPLRGVTGKRGKPQLDKKISAAVLKGLGVM